MKPFLSRLLTMTCAASLLAGSFAFSARPALAEPETPTAEIVVREGNDYATQVLGDPWDMSQPSDVLRGLNFEGRHDFIREYTVSNGIFSGLWVGPQGDQYLLWPGYGYEMLLGQVGAVQPIDASKYKCLYLRMDVDHPTTNGGDYTVVGWQGVDNTAKKGRVSQLISTSDPLYTSWRMYAINLADKTDDGYLSWTSSNRWPGLSFKPTIRENVRFSLDWARLTDCQPVNADVTWKAVSGQTRLWAGTGGRTAKDILVKDGLSSGSASYTWDVQGIQPGIYGLSVETPSGLVSIGVSVRIEAAPVARFSKPSPTSGVDYAASAGNPWDMDGTDIRDLRCIAPAYNGGFLEFDTLPPSLLPGNCKGGIGEADPQFWLSMRGPLAGSNYRYFSFRMFINGTVPLVPDGMIGRLIWTAESGGNKCIQVSDGIPYETGWNTYTIDMQDPALGRAEEVFTLAGSCSRDLFTNAANITDLRFDPNENYTGVLGNPMVPPTTFHQSFDWFKITREDMVKSGSPFSIEFSLSKGMSSGVSLYYTTDRANPTQHSLRTLANQSVPPAGNFRLYLPLAQKDPGSPSSGLTAVWDTGGVAAGRYYVCANLNDGYNSTNWCSDAPVNVLP